MENIEWFKVEFGFYLSGYEVKYKFFEEGDFGSLNQVEFNKEERGGEIDFWGSGHVGIHFVNYLNGDVLMNSFLEPHDVLQKKHAFEVLKGIL